MLSPAESHEQQVHLHITSFTNRAVVNMKTETQRPACMTVNRFLKQVLHRNRLKTPCLVQWDEVFFVRVNMLARMGKLQAYRSEQIIACYDPRQLQCPQNHWKRFQWST